MKEDDNDNAYKIIGLENDVIWGVRVRLTQVHVKIVVLVGAYAAHRSVYVSAVSANKLPAAGHRIIPEKVLFLFDQEKLGVCNDIRDVVIVDTLINVGRLLKVELREVFVPRGSVHIELIWIEHGIFIFPPSGPDIKHGIPP